GFTGGMCDAPALVEAAGPARCLQANLTPLGARRLLGVPMRELTNRVVDLEDVLGPEAGLLAERLAEAPGWRGRLGIADDAAGGRVSWAQLAAECGYFDQSHLVRDVRRFARTTPTELAARLAPEAALLSA